MFASGQITLGPRDLYDDFLVATAASEVLDGRLVPDRGAGDRLPNPYNETRRTLEALIDQLFDIQVHRELRAFMSLPAYLVWEFPSIVFSATMYTASLIIESNRRRLTSRRPALCRST